MGDITKTNPVTPESPLTELESLQVDETSLKMGYKGEYLPPSTLYLNLSIAGQNNVSGKATNFGVKIPITGGLNDLSVFYAKGGMSIGVPMKWPPAPYFGLGNIYFRPGGGVTIGWFSTTSAPNYWFILAATGVVIIQTAISEHDSFEEFGLALSSNLIQQAIPWNTVRELVQKAGAQTQDDVCNSVWNNNILMGCMAYSSSYQKQSLFQVATDMVEDGLKYKYLDPYARALLMSERDRILFNEESGGFTFTAQQRLAQNNKKAVTETNEFLDKYGQWLKDGTTARPEDEDLDRFMANALYLMQKLQLSVEIKDDQFTIKGSAPLVFENGEDLVLFLETIARVYNTLRESGFFWKAFAARLSWDARSLTRDIGIHSTESAVNIWFKYADYLKWFEQMTSPNIQTLFKLRQAHLLWKVKNQYSGKNTEEYLTRLRALKLGDGSDINKLYMDAMNGLYEKDPIETVAASSQIFNGLEYLLRLSDTHDPLTEVIGLDFTPVAHKPAIYKGFETLYLYEKPEEKKIDAISQHMDILFDRIIRYRGKQIEKELKNYDDDVADRVKKIGKSIEKLQSKVEKIDKENKLKTFFDKLTAIKTSLEIKKFSNTVDLQKTEEIESFQFNMAISELRSAIEGLITKTPDPETDEGKKLIKDLQEILTEMENSKDNFGEFISYRNGYTAMNLYMEKFKNTKKQDGKQRASESFPPSRQEK